MVGLDVILIILHEFSCFIFFAGLRKVYPYYFTFTTFTKGRWVGEKILDVFAREFRAHPVEEYVRSFSLLFFLFCQVKLTCAKPTIHPLISVLQTNRLRIEK